MRQVNNAFFQVKMEGNWRNGEMDFKLKNFIFIEPISLKFRQLFIKVLDCLDNKVSLWVGLTFSLIHLKFFLKLQHTCFWVKSK